MKLNKSFRTRHKNGHLKKLSFISLCLKKNKIVSYNTNGPFTDKVFTVYKFNERIFRLRYDILHNNDSCCLHNTPRPRPKNEIIENFKLRSYRSAFWTSSRIGLTYLTLPTEIIYSHVVSTENTVYVYLHNVIAKQQKHLLFRCSKAGSRNGGLSRPSVRKSNTIFMETRASENLERF